MRSVARPRGREAVRVSPPAAGLRNRRRPPRRPRRRCPRHGSGCARSSSPGALVRTFRCSSVPIITGCIATCRCCGASSPSSSPATRCASPAPMPRSRRWPVRPRRLGRVPVSCASRTPSTWVLQGTHSYPRSPQAPQQRDRAGARAPRGAARRARRRRRSPRARSPSPGPLLLTNHFHDSICGTVSDVVARTMETRFAAVEAAGKEITRRALHRIVGHDPDQRTRRIRRSCGPGSSSGIRPPRPRGGVVLARISAFRRDVLVGPPGDRVARVGSDPSCLGAGLTATKCFPLQVIAASAPPSVSTPIITIPISTRSRSATVAMAAPADPWAGLSASHSAPSRGRIRGLTRLASPRRLPPVALGTSPSHNDLVARRLFCGAGASTFTISSATSASPASSRSSASPTVAIPTPGVPTGRERVLGPGRPGRPSRHRLRPAVWRTRGGLVGSHARHRPGFDLRLTVQLFAGQPHRALPAAPRQSRGRIIVSVSACRWVSMASRSSPAPSSARCVRDRPDLDGSPLEAARRTAPGAPVRRGRRATIVASPSWHPVSSRPSGSTATCT